MKAKGLDYRTSTGLEKLTLGGHKQNLVLTRTQEKGEVTPKEPEPDFPIVSRSLQWRHGSIVRTVECNSPGSSGVLGLLLPQIGLTPNNREGTQPHPLADN